MAILLAGGGTLALAGDLACVCTGLACGNGGPLGCFCKSYCGNGGIGADPNFFDLGLDDKTVSSSYGGGKAGNKTGWLCGDWRGDKK